MKRINLKLKPKELRIIYVKIEETEKTTKKGEFAIFSKSDFDKKIENFQELIQKNTEKKLKAKEAFDVTKAKYESLCETLSQSEPSNEQKQMLLKHNFKVVEDLEKQIKSLTEEINAMRAEEVLYNFEMTNLFLERLLL